MKSCFKCGLSKPFSEFYAHPKMADGHLGKCKVCTKNDVAEHRSVNIESVRAYDRARANVPHRRAARIRILQQWKLDNPDGRKAHLLVQYAIRKGELSRLPCEVCGKEKAEAHHPHYGAPLLVTWLCRSHHMMIHHTAA